MVFPGTAVTCACQILPPFVRLYDFLCRIGHAMTPSSSSPLYGVCARTKKCQKRSKYPSVSFVSPKCPTHRPRALTANASKTVESHTLVRCGASRKGPTTWKSIFGVFSVCSLVGSAYDFAVQCPSVIFLS